MSQKLVVAEERGKGARGREEGMTEGQPHRELTLLTRLATFCLGVELTRYDSEESRDDPADVMS